MDDKYQVRTTNLLFRFIFVCYLVEFAMKLVAFGFVLAPWSYLRRAHWYKLEFIVVISILLHWIFPFNSFYLSLTSIRAFELLEFAKFQLNDDQLSTRIE